MLDQILRANRRRRKISGEQRLRCRQQRGDKGALGRPRDTGQFRHIHLLLRRGRGRLVLGTALGRTRNEARAIGGHGFCRLWSAPESLARSFAESLKTIHNVKLVPACDALLVICPEHEPTFRNADCSKARLYEELYELREIPGEELVAGAKGIAERGPASLAGQDCQQNPVGSIDQAMISNGRIASRKADRGRWR